MTRNDIYNFVSQLLDGYSMDQTMFDTFLDIAQATLEGSHPWRILLTEDATQSWSPGDTYATAKTLPTSFLNYETEKPIVAVGTDGSHTILREVPISEKFRYQYVTGKFYVDLTTNSLYVCGTATKPFTLHQFFIKESALVSAQTGGVYNNTWVFPTRFHKILGLYIAVYYKLGPDYDIISNSQANQFAAMAGALFDIMLKWDSRMQVSQIRGVDPYNDDEDSYENSNRVSF